MKKYILKTLYIIVALIILIQTNVAIAATKSELNSSQKELDNKIDEAKEKLDDIEEEKSETLAQVEKLIAQISEYETTIEDLNKEISNLNTQISEAEKNIKQAEEEYAKNQKLLDERIITMYEEGNMSYLDIILSSKDITSLISNYYMISELVQCDTDLLSQIEEKRKSIEDKKNALETSKTELANKKATEQQKKNELKQAKNEKDKAVKQLTEEEKQTQKDLEEFEADKKSIQSKLAEIARQEEEARKKQGSSGGSSNVVTAPSASGYIFPVPGLTKSNISNKTYPSYAGHTGVDVNINVRGKSVVAVKDGTVVTSTALTGSIANYGTNGTYSGSYRSYGEYVVINHHDGTMTLYAHMLPGSRKVKEGDTVKQGQVIGSVGNTGNVRPRPSVSSPLNGTHLHFEVLVGVNSRPVNPLPYLP